MDHQKSTTQKFHQPLPPPRLIKGGHLCFVSFLIFFSSSIFLFYLISPLQPLSLFRFYLSRIIPEEKVVGKPHGVCDYSHGRWVRDEGHKLLSYNEDCPFLDPGFRCRSSGREDVEYMNWRWQPEGCDLPGFNARDMLERSRNGRIVFAGDSIGRNQWESFLCLLAQVVSNKSTIYEANGSPITKHKGFLSMRFSEYNLSVEYYRDPFLVAVGRPPKNSPADIKATIKVDKLHWYSKKWVGANILVFNAGHWWNKDKTVKMGVYFEEGGVVNRTMSVMEAFRRSLETLKSWAVENLDMETSHVFFRSYSPSHYRNGSWNDGGRCDLEMQPETNNSRLEPEPMSDKFASGVIQQMKDGNRKVQFLNITMLSEYRFDGHPSIHREPGTRLPAPQDCSHWCLPGVPDTWNEILYAHLVSMGFRTK